MRRQVPAQRWQAFASVAAASREGTVVVAYLSRAVRRQYEAAVPRLGGRLENVVFKRLDDFACRRGEMNDAPERGSEPRRDK